MRLDDLIEKLKEILESQHDPGLPVCIEQMVDMGITYMSDVDSLEVIQIESEIILLLKPEYEEAPTSMSIEEFLAGESSGPLV